MEGFKLMAVQPVDMARRPLGSPLVAVDSVGAGPGELVLIVAGSSARYTSVTKERPTDLTILAIVDTVSLEGQPDLTGHSAPGGGSPPSNRAEPGRPDGVSSGRPRKGGSGA